MIRAPTKIPIAHTDNWIPPRGRTLGSAGTYDRGSLKTDRRFLCPFTGKPHLRQKGVLWNFSTAQSAYYRLWLSLLEQDLAFGALSISWRATEMIIRAQMLMYSKEANNRKQEIDRQHHTIPNQRANDKHHGNVYNLLFRYGKVRSQNMEKLKSSFPTFCKRTFPQLHKIASYAHYAQCRLLRKPSHFIIYSRKLYMSF